MKNLQHLQIFAFFNFILLCSVETWAQVDTTKKNLDFTVSDETQSIGTYNLDQCIEYALQYSEALKKQEMQIKISKEEVGERLATGYPTLKFESQFQDNLQIQKQFFDISTLDPTQPSRIIGAQFGLKYAANASFQLEQLILDFSYFIGLKGARTYVELAEKQLNLSKIDIIENVIKAYYGVLINQERLTLLRLNVYRLDSLLKDTKVLNKNGLVEKIDVNRAEVAYNNMVTERDKAEKLHEITTQLLKFQMGMPVRDSIILEGNLKDLKFNLEDDLQAEPNYKSRLEYSILETNQALQIINMKYNKSIYYPRLYGFGNLGANTGQNEFGEVWKFRRNWENFSNIGLNFSWTLFDGLKRRHTLQKIRLEMQKIDEDKKILKRNVDFEVERSKKTLISNLKDLEIQKRNMELAQEVAKLSRVKYGNGIMTNIEIINAESAFKEAELNYFTAYYDAIISKIELDKALGKLDKK
jgi:outer membrane protein